jgi:hypothetical protein
MLKLLRSALIGVTQAGSGRVVVCGPGQQDDTPRLLAHLAN